MAGPESWLMELEADGRSISQPVRQKEIVKTDQSRPLWLLLALADGMALVSIILAFLCSGHH
jgi:hypothetical protein